MIANPLRTSADGRSAGRRFLEQHVGSAAELELVRCRTVVRAELMWNVYNAVKSFFSTILELPVVGQVVNLISPLLEILNLPGVSHLLDLFNGVVHMCLMARSLPAFRLICRDAEGKVVAELRAVEELTIFARLFPSFKAATLDFVDTSGRSALVYEMPRRPLCSLFGRARRGKLTDGETSELLVDVSPPTMCQRMTSCEVLHKSLVCGKPPAGHTPQRIKLPFFSRRSGGYCNCGEPFISLSASDTKTLWLRTPLPFCVAMQQFKSAVVDEFTGAATEVVTSTSSVAAFAVGAAAGLKGASDDTAEARGGLQKLTKRARTSFLGSAAGVSRSASLAAMQFKPMLSLRVPGVADSKRTPEEKLAAVATLIYVDFLQGGRLYG